MVLAVVAGITVMTLRHYRQYQQKIEASRMAQDVDLLFAGLNDYYHASVCDQGVFQEEGVDLIDKVKATLSKKQIVWLKTQDVKAFHAKVLKVDNVTTQQSQPVYRLELSAEMNNEGVQGRMQWYQQKFNAKRSASNVLYWSRMPGDMTVGAADAAENSGAALMFKATQRLAGDPHCAH